ncbi:MAG: hypothetical protein Q9191_001126 [Dirinaria sp. TL-2023a]
MEFNPKLKLWQEMASTGQQNGSFGILGSAKLNTQDAKNPQSKGSTVPDMVSGQTADASKQEDYRRECQRAHDEMEARLKDEELHGRSKGWSG